ncbi:MAG: lipopolysaccharide biosynthesis protein [Bryobacteraceae bacterium]|nr:lipopolysaccharide biosynthesis protein [Bryobacteraceae bacterium]
MRKPFRPTWWSSTVWSLAGNGAASLSQWAIVVIVARWLGFRAGGEYALALAVVNPIVTLANLQLRAILASDAAGRFAFWDYLSMRLWTSLAAAVAVVQFGTWNPQLSATVLLGVLAVKLVESMSDLYYGAFQRADRLDWIAQSTITKASLSLGLLLLVGALWNSLALGLFAAAVGSGIVWSWFDCAQASKLKLKGAGRLLPDWPPNWPALRSLLETSLPLGVVMMLISLNQSLPRFAIEKHVGREELGQFAAIAAMAQAVNLALNAVGQSATAPLSRMAMTRDWPAFRAMFGKQFAVGLLIVVGSTAVSAVFGTALLALVFGNAGPDQSWILVLQMFAAGMTALAGLCGYALTALGEFRRQLLLFIPVTSLTAVLCRSLIPNWGVEGAAWVMVLSATAHLAAAGVFLNASLARAGKGESSPSARPREAA